jgi:DNA-binding transcriptional LysR family regulator
VLVSGDVQIRQLEYLVALARERHFGRAAAACHASQPALSAAVRKLEAALKVTIVHRGRRFSGFTEEGRHVVGWAHRILAERDALRADLGRIGGGLTAMLRIGAIPTAVPATALLSDAFCAANPHAAVRVESLSSREIGSRLADFALDVGLTYTEGGLPAGIVTRELYRERYVLLTPAGGPFDGSRSAGWAEAAALPLCALTPDMQNRGILDGAVAAAGARLRPVVEADTVAALYAHVTGGRRSAIIAHTWLRAFGVPPGMQAVPMAEPAPRPAVGILTAGTAPGSLVAAALLEVLDGLDIAAALDETVVALLGGG